MDKVIFFGSIVIFPFGQLIKVGIINLFDVLVLALAAVTLLKKPTYPIWYKYFLPFLFISAFSLIFNYQLTNLESILYQVRLWSYSMVAVYIQNYSKKSLAVSHYLLTVSMAAAIFGWLQYIFWPDLRPLLEWGWDDHYLRMAGTFLDPTFLGIILVLGATIAVYKKNYLIFTFLAFSLLFTYSRASYLALFVVLVLEFFKNKNLSRFLLLNSVFLILLFIPKDIGEGTNLARTYSGFAKLENYKDSLFLISHSPVIGMGFNNTCAAKVHLLNEGVIDSHACSGVDSSILFILVTTGVVGLVLFVSFVLRVTSLPHTTYYILLTTSFMAVIVHSLFANSLFYPHVMFWLFALLGLAWRKVDSKG